MNKNKKEIKLRKNFKKRSKIKKKNIKNNDLVQKKENISLYTDVFIGPVG